MAGASLQTLIDRRDAAQEALDRIVLGGQATAFLGRSRQEVDAPWLERYISRLDRQIAGLEAESSGQTPNRVVVDFDRGWPA